MASSDNCHGGCMLAMLERLFASRKGATAVEYGLICALIVLGAMGAITTFGTRAIGMWNNVANEVTRD